MLFACVEPIPVKFWIQSDILIWGEVVSITASFAIHL